jgi:hypothetical protein
MGIKDFFMRKMIERKLQGVPREEQEQITKLVQDNPEFFQKIALEVQEEMKRGKDQMTATMEVMKKYESELRGIIQK